MMLILFSDFLPLALESHGFLGLLLTLLVGSTFPFEDEISLQKLGPLALGVLLAVHMADRLPTNLRDFRSEEQTFHHKDLPVPPNTLLESKLSNYSAPLSEVLKKTRSTTQLSNCAFSVIFLYICIYIYIYRTNLLGVFGSPYCFALPAVLTICARFLRTSANHNYTATTGRVISQFECPEHVTDHCTPWSFAGL